MRTGRTEFTLASMFALLCGAVLTGQANAQTDFASAMRRPAMQQVGFLSDCGGCSSSSCTDGCGSGCGNGCSSACGDGCGSLLDGCSGCGASGCCGGGGLFSNLDFGGWLATGYYDNSHGISSGSGNAPLGFNNVADQWQVHQAWTYLGKEAKTGNGFDWGFRADLMFGTDGPDTQAFGDGSWDFSWTTSGESGNRNRNQYGFALPQFYGEIAVGKTKVKAGKFYTIVGYEVVQAPDNFFYSHVYTFYYNEPFSHTGVLVERPLGENITLYGGWTAGWDTGYDNRNDGSVFLGGMGVQLTEDIKFTYATSWGDPGDDPLFTTDVFMNSIVCDVTLTEKLNYVFHADFQTRTPNRAVGEAWKQYGIVNYLTRDITDKLAFGARYEWFYVGENAGPPLGVAALTPGTHFNDLTFGLNWKPRENFVVKPEIRYDWVDFDGAAVGGPFARGTKRSQFTWGWQSILSF